MRSVLEMCESIGLTHPRTLIEAGSAHPYSYRLGHYVTNRPDSRVILIEANPRLHYCLSVGWNQGDFSDTWPSTPVLPHDHGPVEGPGLRSIINAAVADIGGGTTTVYECNASSYVAGVRSPAIVNDGFSPDSQSRQYSVPSISIASVDDGQVDVLLADVEGSEWYCVKNLTSRPRLIVLEMAGGGYTNPFSREIHEWMGTNGYAELESDATDTAWTRKDTAS